MNLAIMICGSGWLACRTTMSMNWPGKRHPVITYGDGACYRTTSRGHAAAMS